MEARAAQLIALLGEHHSLGNGKARQLLGWDEATYEEVKQALVASGQVAQGRGRGGSIALVGVASFLARTGQEAHEPASPQANGQEPPEPSSQEATGPKARKPKATKATDQDPILMQHMTATDPLRSNFAALLCH